MLHFIEKYLMLNNSKDFRTCHRIEGAFEYPGKANSTVNLFPVLTHVTDRQQILEFLKLQVLMLSTTSLMTLHLRVHFIHQRRALPMAGVTAQCSKLNLGPLPLVSECSFQTPTSNSASW